MFEWTYVLDVPRSLNPHVTVAVGNKLYCFGLQDDTMRDPENSDLWVQQMEVILFNTVSFQWRKLSSSSLLNYSFTAVLVGDTTVYLWGGYFRGLYAFDIHTHIWSKPQVSGTDPEGREGHLCCVLGKKVLFISGDVNIRDIFTLDTRTMVWTLINSSNVTSRHSPTVIGTKMFVFRGCAHNKPIRVFDTETNCWLDNKPSTGQLPEKYKKHLAFTYNGELYVFGRTTKLWWHKKTTYKDMWKFNPGTFSWKMVKRPKGEGPARMSEMHCCLLGDRVFLLGGTHMHVLDLSPRLKTRCKEVVIHYGLERDLPHNVRWELPDDFWDFRSLFQGSS